MASGSRNGQRLWRAQRDQTSWDMICLDDLLSADHRARQVWAYVEGCDLSVLYEKIRAVEGGVGRAAIDPAILMALWLYATLEGVGSARLLDRLCSSDAAYRWICGGVGMNYHTLSDFRVEAGAVLDDLLTRSMAGLAQAGIVDLSCLGVDGVRVRASAGASSFRRQPRLSELHDLARQRVAELKAELESDPASNSRRKVERDLREAEARAQRIEAAQKAAAAIEAERVAEAVKQRRRQPKNGKPPRGSTTDAQARVMAMADGGFRPGYNLQFKTELTHGFVVGIEITNRAADRGQLEAAVAEVERRYQVRPKRLLADSGYDSKDDIDAQHGKGIEVFCPVPRSRSKPVPAEAEPEIQAAPTEAVPAEAVPAEAVPAEAKPEAKKKPKVKKKPKAEEKPGVVAWHKRMAEEESTTIYARRITCERPHADVRNRGLYRFLVRGLDKVKAVALWHVTAYNFLQIQRLMPQAA
jgi:transposase